MKELIIKINRFLEKEFELNKTNYLLDNKNDWLKILKDFSQEFLSENMEDNWFKIPVEHFSPERRKQLQLKITKRELYLIKSLQNNIINAFTSPPDESKQLRNCFIFKNNNNNIQLLSIENICENCFGTGFIEMETHRCNRCSGAGFNYSENRKFVSWNTIFIKKGYVIETIVVNLPSSEIQKKIIKMQ